MADLERVFALIAAHPAMGRPADKIRAGLRRHEHGVHVLFYRLDEQGVLVMAVVHRKMRPDLDPEFRCTA